MGETRVVIAAPEGALLSSVYGLYDILRYAASHDRSDLQVSIEFPHQQVADDQIDVFLIPAFSGLGPRRLIRENTSLIQRIARLSEKGQVVGGVCIGGFLLAEAGVAGAGPMTTHWKYFDLMAAMYPHITVERRRVLIDGGRYLSGGGITSYQDLALYLIKKFISEEAAKTTAKVFLIDPEDRIQLAYIIRSLNPEYFDELSDTLQGFIQENFHRPIGLAQMAQAVGGGERTLIRHFQKSMGMTPSAYLRLLRIEHARTLLESTDQTVERVAEESGYSDVSAFYRAFVDVVGMPPGRYRSRRR